MCGFLVASNDDIVADVGCMQDMNKEEHGAKPTSEGAKPIVDILEGKRDAEHGGYLNANGQYPW